MSLEGDRYIELLEKFKKNRELMTEEEIMELRVLGGEILPKMGWKHNMNAFYYCFQLFLEEANKLSKDEKKYWLEKLKYFEDNL